MAITSIQNAKVGPSLPPPFLAANIKIATLFGQSTPPLYGSSMPGMALRTPSMGYASNSLRLIIQRFQNKTLRRIAGAPWYVRNDTLHIDLCVPTVAETITMLTLRYEKRLHHHPNTLALTLLDNLTTLHRLSRRHCANLVLPT